MDKVATCSKPQFISIKISSWVLCFCLLAQVTGHQNRSFSCFGEEQKQANIGNLPIDGRGARTSTLFFTTNPSVAHSKSARGSQTSILFFFTTNPSVAHKRLCFFFFTTNPFIDF